MRSRFFLIGILALVSMARAIIAGGSGLNVAVVINQNSTNSIQLANAYCQARGVPPQNVLRLNWQWSGGPVFCQRAEFQSQMVVPLMNMLQSRHLTNQVEYILLSMDIPYEVLATNGENSSSSVLFYGFKPDGPPVVGISSCSLPDDSTNSYAFSELPFSQAQPDTAPTNSFLAVMLTDTNLAFAEATLARGVASDSTFPEQTVILEKTDDTARNVRYSEFDDAIFEARIQGAISMIRTNSDSTSFSDVLGLETGLANFALPTNAFVPGSIADNLTSFGGDILTDMGQTPLLAFLEAGAVASYGTVIEPCNWPQKFPHPLDYFYQARGFSLAEAYYQSVLIPHQGIMVGEPLSAPFAQRGTGTWLGLPGGTPTLSGVTNLQLSFSAAADLPLSQVDLFIDGTWFTTLTNISPAAGDVLSVTLNGQTSHYTVPAGANLAGVASNLANVINAAYNQTEVAATPWGDRIELQSGNGSNVSLEAGVTNNSGASTTMLRPALPTLLDSIATGYHTLLTYNNPSVGDWLQLQVTLTNGEEITLGVTNENPNWSIGDMTQSLMDQINGAPALQSGNGVYAADLYTDSDEAEFNIYAQSGGFAASAIQVNLTCSSDLGVYPPGPAPLQDNMSDLVPRDDLYVAAGKTSLPVRWTFNTGEVPDGYHQLTAVAYEGTSVRTQTQATQNVLVHNTTLSATLNTLYGGSNTALSATLRFSVTANTGSDIIQLFSTGGLLVGATNEETAEFSVAATNLGLGLHPFYAIITSGAAQYRTATTWINIIGQEPSFDLSVKYPPLTLAWPATAGRAYEVMRTTNMGLGAGFETIATLTPSNSTATWIDSNAPSKTAYYRVETSN